MTSKLIPPERCSLRPYWTQAWGPFKHAGVIVLTPHVELPEWNTWDRVPYNRLLHISTNGYVDGVEELNIIPVKINTEPCEWMFDTELGDRYEINRKDPAIAFFMGNDDWSYGLRFPTFEERDRMLAEFGEELGFFPLHGHN